MPSVDGLIPIGNAVVWNWKQIPTYTIGNQRYKSGVKQLWANYRDIKMKNVTAYMVTRNVSLAGFSLLKSNTAKV
jgi:hypothetical protein